MDQLTKGQAPLPPSTQSATAQFDPYAPNEEISSQTELSQMRSSRPPPASTYATSSLITLGSSHTTNPPSDVTPASLFPWTDISLTATELGNSEGNCKSVRSPLDREITRTRPTRAIVKTWREGLFDEHSPFVMAYATQCVAPMVVPGRNVESTLTRAIAVDLTESCGAWISSNRWDTSKTIVCCALL